jgi:lysozyme family protein
VSGFAQALPFVLAREGGYVDHPLDKGGPTNFGVTQATFDRWLASKGKPPRPVKEITDEEVAAVYHADYWLASKCDALPWPASLAHFDAAVNHGPLRAAYMLQEALGVEADGKIGPKTLAAAAAIHPSELVDRLLWIRVKFYQAISKGDQLVFLRGWLARVLELRRHAA